MRGSLATKGASCHSGPHTRAQIKKTETQQHKPLTTENSHKAISWDGDGKEETQSHINANFWNHVVLHAPQL